MLTPSTSPVATDNSEELTSNHDFITSEQDTKPPATNTSKSEVSEEAHRQAQRVDVDVPSSPIRRWQIPKEISIIPECVSKLYMYPGPPSYLMLNENNKIIMPNNQSAVLNSSRDCRASLEKAGKSIYCMQIVFTSKETKRSSTFVVNGTAIHVGEGLFITAAHNLQYPDLKFLEAMWSIPSALTPESHNYEIILKSGPGEVGELGNPADRRFSAERFAFTPWIENELRKQSKIDLLPTKFVVPQFADFAVLKAKPLGLLQRLYAHMRGIEYPKLLPLSLKGRKLDESIPNSSLLTVNGLGYCCYGQKNYYPKEQKQTIQDAYDKLLPQQISIAKTTGVPSTMSSDCIVSYDVSTTHAAPDCFRYAVGAAPGSSGGALVDEDYRMYGVHISGEVDEKTRLPEHGDCSVAISLSAPEVADVIKNRLVPELKRMATVKSLELAKLWEDII